MLEDIINTLSIKIQEKQEKLLIHYIISIYNRIFKTYDEYKNSVIKYNETAKEMSETQSNSIFSFSYYPEVALISKEIFNYIIELRDDDEQLKGD